LLSIDIDGNDKPKDEEFVSLDDIEELF